METDLKLTPQQDSGTTRPRAQNQDENERSLQTHTLLLNLTLVSLPYPPLIYRVLLCTLHAPHRNPDSLTRLRTWIGLMRILYILTV